MSWIMVYALSRHLLSTSTKELITKPFCSGCSCALSLSHLLTLLRFGISSLQGRQHGERQHIPTAELTAWYNDPKEVHQNEVKPEVKGLRSRVRYASNIVVEETCRIIKDISIELAHADQHLQRIPHRMPRHNERGNQQTSRSPEQCSDTLHAKDKRVLRQVPRVRECILLPHLAEEGLLRSQSRVICCIVSFEEDMDRPREDEPHYREQFTPAQ